MEKQYRSIEEIQADILQPEADLEKLEIELNEVIEARNAENAKIEKRAELERKALAMPTAVEQFEERKENKMEENKVLEANSPEYRSAWLKVQMGKATDVEQRSVNAAAVPGAIPEVTLNKIIEKLNTITPLLAKTSNFNVPGDFKLPVEGTVNAAALHTENALITGASDTIVEVILGGYEITKLIRISRKALAMSIDAFETYIVNALAKYVGRRISGYMISGTGSNQPQGVDFAQTWADTTNAVAFTAAAPTAAELLELISYLPGEYANGACWLTSHAYFWGKLQGIRDDSKYKITERNGMDWFIFGYPVVFDDQVADGDIFFGDFSQMYTNMAEPINVLKSEHSGLPYNAVDYLGKCLFDCKVALGEAFVKGAATL